MICTTIEELVAFENRYQPTRPAEYIPTEGDIAATCLEIQNEWSRNEAARRRLGILHGKLRGGEQDDAIRLHWSPPQVKAPLAARHSGGGMYGGRTSSEATLHAHVRAACIAVGFNPDDGTDSEVQP